MSPSALHGQPPQPRGIEGLRGRDPVGVAVAVGRKDSARGFPIEKDRFHLVAPRETDRVRQPLEIYRQFNTAEPQHRRMLRATLVHSAPRESFAYHLRAQVLPDRPAHPGRRPHCVGDGRKAVRWGERGADAFTVIACPHDRCQFRQPDGRKPAPCKPFVQLVFQLRWKEGSPLPSMLAKFSSGGWNTCANILGFFEHLGRVCGAASGGGTVSLVGFPFLLTLQEQTNRKKKSRFPVVRLTPEVDPADFVRRQRDIAALLPPGAPARIADVGPAETFEDHAALHPGPLAVPGNPRENEEDAR